MNLNGLIGLMGNPIPSTNGVNGGIAPSPHPSIFGRLAGGVKNKLKQPSFYQHLSQVMQRPTPMPQPMTMSEPAYGGMQMFGRSSVGNAPAPMQMGGMNQRHNRASLYF